MTMQKVISITSQGQLSIPRAFLDSLGITETTKAVLHKKGNILEIHTKGDFWSLESSFQSSVTLSDAELKNARQKFTSSWPNK